ncbi:hypothetical protein AMATHDRAFT_144428 [Amanita thiersii Skay4041]|uniref:Ribosomal RNA-processing protein 41 n=1 Tax=Amanita thiersii Skay4041 TaxID=703135 RepID=A0A2A9NSP7_9AGAR|nr:hypothetical protein AMATHDRAFT_144428 [Amanita thiersii Skay4041]
MEVLNADGYRSDGRRQFELRSITIDLAQHGAADGTATIVHGLTKVFVSVLGPREAKLRSLTIHDRANVNVEVNVAAFSSGERRKRAKSDKRVLEMASAIKSTFETIIQTNLYPRSQIDIYIQIIEQDGGLLQACINGTTLALICAGIPLVDFACAVTCGVYANSPILDLTTLEENDIPNMTLAMLPKTGSVNLTAMESRLHVDRFGDLFEVALGAGRVIHEEMKLAILAKSRMLVAEMKTIGWGEKDLVD